ncbi:transcriptional regulator [Pseudonocardia sp. CNS-139]|nr:transcriptional regulator [Pseudonocardia sp. CNS-139]
MHESVPGFRMPDDAQVRRAAEAFRLLSDPTRVRILAALLQGETSVACLADLCGVTPTSVSQHLAKLRLAGLVQGRREGTFVYYVVADDRLRRLLADALDRPDTAEPGREPVEAAGTD